VNLNRKFCLVSMLVATKRGGKKLARNAELGRKPGPPESGPGPVRLTVPQCHLHWLLQLPTLDQQWPHKQPRLCLSLFWVCDVSPFSTGLVSNCKGIILHDVGPRLGSRTPLCTPTSRARTIRTMDSLVFQRAESAGGHLARNIMCARARASRADIFDFRIRGACGRLPLS
jgi:hypothetical protein